MAQQREVIATFDPELPAGYDKLDGLEFVEQKDGNVRVNGLLKLGTGEDLVVKRVLVPEPDMMWGYDPEEFQRYKEDPEKWEMAQKIENLEARVNALEEELSRLRRATATGGNTAETAAATPETKAGVAEDPPMPDMNDQPDPAEQASPDTADNPTETAETTTVETVEVETPDQKSWWQRTRDRVMGPVYGSHAATITRRKKYEYDDEGRVIVEEEESDERQRRTGLIAGATALVGAGVGLGLGYLIWHKTGHDVNNYYYNGAEVAGPPVMPGSGGGGGANVLNHATQHLETYNLAHGTDIVQVELPQQFDLVTDSTGVASLKDMNTGRTILSGDALPHGLFRSDGRLSVAAVERLQDMDLDISSMPKKIVTVNGNTAKHFVSVVSK